MGITSFLKKQFIDVIQWTENSADAENPVLAYRYPMQDQEIQNGGLLTVREGQLAVFVNEGIVADVFNPGLHTLTTKTLPLLTNLKNWDKAFASPFKSDVYFFNARELLNQKWGTPEALTIRDKELGAIRLRAFGSYSYKITDAKTFYQKVSATREVCHVSDLEGQLKATIATQMGSVVGSGQVAFLDMATNQMGFSNILKSSISPMFSSYGLELQTFMIESLSLPEEVQKYLDKASSMRVVGDMQKYTQFQAADSISLAAQNQSGGAVGTVMGIGVGAAMGQMMAGALSGSVAGQVAQKVSAEEVTATLEKLHGLLKAGIITQTDFDEKKSELLKKL